MQHRRGQAGVGRDDIGAGIVTAARHDHRRGLVGHAIDLDPIAHRAVAPRLDQRAPYVGGAAQPALERRAHARHDLGVEARAGHQRKATRARARHRLAGPHQQRSPRDHGARHLRRREAESQFVRQHVGRAQRHDADGGRRVAATGKPVDHLVDRAVAARDGDHRVAMAIACLRQPPRIAGRPGLDDIDGPAFVAHPFGDRPDQATAPTSGGRIDDQQHRP
jgi:hypothetical protein